MQKKKMPSCRLHGAGRPCQARLLRHHYRKRLPSPEKGGRSCDALDLLERAIPQRSPARWLLRLVMFTGVSPPAFGLRCSHLALTTPVPSELSSDRRPIISAIIACATSRPTAHCFVRTAVSLARDRQRQRVLCAGERGHLPCGSSGGRRITADGTRLPPGILGHIPQSHSQGGAAGQATGSTDSAAARARTALRGAQPARHVAIER